MTEIRSNLRAHPTSAQVAGFLDGCLDTRDREVLVAHLANCAQCRREVVELRLALPEAAVVSHSKRTWWGPAAAGIAAILLVAVAVPQFRTLLFASSDTTRERAAAAVTPVDGASPIRITMPSDGAVLDSTLAWNAAGLDAVYQVTITDSTGTVMWSTTLSDTSVLLPSSVALRNGHRYLWSVDARLADGFSTRSRVQSFVAR